MEWKNDNDEVITTLPVVPCEKVVLDSVWIISSPLNVEHITKKLFIFDYLSTVSERG